MRDRLEAQGIPAADVAERCQIPPAFTQTFLKGQEQSTKHKAQSTRDPAPSTKHQEQETKHNAPSTKSPRFILVTGHRRESFGEGFEKICRAILGIAEAHPDVGILYPVHLNPRVQEPVNRLLGNNPRIALIPPVGYSDFIWLMNRCHFALSDSGGVQEEAPSLGKPVLVMRETTERPEGVEAGTCRLVGTDPEKILSEANILLNDATEYARRSALKNPYGDGTAAEKIRTILEAEV
ncbi:MAG: UDP-N-acetylglucosamine 2-epimerase (non-hydrolyzing) [Opitutales bacterium]|nr:UDP-N-acetylglucosamine 2-epimerase (non-hydrolyzing) [Opitutales bacterium]